MNLLSERASSRLKHRDLVLQPVESRWKRRLALHLSFPVCQR
jgi:hypothetical protein